MHQKYQQYGICFLQKGKNPKLILWENCFIRLMLRGRITP